MNSEAKRLQSLQLALDQHEQGCGDPVRAILMNPFECERLDWEEFRGIPIEPCPDLPTGLVKIDCLTTTVREGYEAFKDFYQDEEGLADAEARFDAKLEQLAAAIDDWWKEGRSERWWKNAAHREPQLYRRAVQGEELNRYERLRMELAQLPSPRDRDLTDLFERWDQAYADFSANLSDMDRNPGETRQDLPDLVQNRTLRSPKITPKIRLRDRFQHWITSLARLRQRRRLRRDLLSIGRKLS